jgi:hypothetical protein
MTRKARTPQKVPTMAVVILKLPIPWKDELQAISQRKGITFSKLLRMAIAKAYSLPEEQA